MQVEAPTLSQESADADNHGDGSLDEAAAAFAAPKPEAEKSAAAEQQQQQTEDEETQEGDDAKDSKAEPEEGDPADDTPSEDAKIVEIAGEKVELPAKIAEEVEKGYLRQADYTRKTQEVAAKAKDAEGKLEQAKQMAASAEAYAEVLSEARMLDARIKQYEALNWQELRRDNPGEFGALSAELQGLRMTRQEIGAKAADVNRKVETERQAADTAKREAMFETLAKELPNWGDELGGKITAYAVSIGWTAEDLTRLTDPRVVIALEKARKFDNIEKGKADALKKAQPAPKVLKPGAPKARVDAREQAMTRLKQSNSMDDAAAAFLTRMR